MLFLKLGFYESTLQKPFNQMFLLWGNRGGLSLTSVRVMFTVVVPDNPPIWPPMSLAWITTWYCSLFSRSISPLATFQLIPATKQPVPWNPSHYKLLAVPAVPCSIFPPWICFGCSLPYKVILSITHFIYTWKIPSLCEPPGMQSMVSALSVSFLALIQLHLPLFSFFLRQTLFLGQQDNHSQFQSYILYCRASPESSHIPRKALVSPS